MLGFSPISSAPISALPKTGAMSGSAILTITPTDILLRQGQMLVANAESGIVNTAFASVNEPTYNFNVSSNTYSHFGGTYGYEMSGFIGPFAAAYLNPPLVRDTPDGSNRTIYYRTYFNISNTANAPAANSFSYDYQFLGSLDKSGANTNFDIRYQIDFTGLQRLIFFSAGYAASNTINFVTPAKLSTNTWYRIEFDISKAGRGNVFIDGVLQGSFSNSKFGTDWSGQLFGIWEQEAQVFPGNNASRLVLQDDIAINDTAYPGIVAATWPLTSNNTTITLTPSGTSKFYANFNAETGDTTAFKSYPSNLANHTTITTNVGQYWSGGNGYKISGTSQRTTGDEAIYISNVTNIDKFYGRWYVMIPNTANVAGTYEFSLLNIRNAAGTNAALIEIDLFLNTGGTQSTIEFWSNGYANLNNYTFTTMSNSRFIRVEIDATRSQNVANVYVNGTLIGSPSNVNFGTDWTDFLGLVGDDGGTNLSNNTIYLDDISLTTMGPPGPINTTWNIVSSATETFTPVDVALKGKWTGTGTTSVVFTPVDVALKGKWTGTGSTSFVFTPNSNLLGSGSQAGTTTLAFTQFSTLLGSGTQAGSTLITFTPNSSVLGKGSQAGSTTVTFTPVDVALKGAGAISGSSTIIFVPYLNTIISAPISGATTLTFTPTGAVLGKGSISSSTNVIFTPVDVALKGAGTVSSASTLVFTPILTLLGAGSISSNTTISFAPTSIIVGKTLLTASTTLLFSTSGNVLGAGSISSSTTENFVLSSLVLGSGSGAGSGTISFTTYSNTIATALLFATSNIVFSPTASVLGKGSITSTSTLLFTLNSTVVGAGTQSGSSTLVFTQSNNPIGLGSVSGNTTIVFNPLSNLLGKGSINANTTLLFIPIASISGSVPVQGGTSLLTFTPKSSITGNGAFNSSLTLSFIPTLTIKGLGSINGAGTISFVPKSSIAGLANIPISTTSIVFTLGSLLYDAPKPFFEIKTTVNAGQVFKVTNPDNTEPKNINSLVEQGIVNVVLNKNTGNPIATVQVSTPTVVKVTRK